MTATVTQQTTENGTLPESWGWITLSEIGTVASGGTPNTKEPSNFDGDIPWITPADLSGYTDKTIAQGKRNISQKGLDSSSARLLPEGAIIFSSRAPVGYVVIAGNAVSTNQGCKHLFPSNGVFNEYVYYYLKGSKSLAESYASGTTFLELSGKAFGRLPIPLPPLNEQRRIVEKIEELFTKLDAGVRSLEQARAQLKSYRRSVLKAAVEGELSREWREAHRGELESASELLERILQERREKFTGKKYKEPASPDTSELPALPDGWEWSTLTMLCTNIGDVDHKMPKGQEEGVPYISTKDFLPNGDIDFDRAKLIAVEDYERLCRKILPERNDILLSRYGTVGEVRLINTDQPFQASYSIAIIKPASHSISKFLAWALQGEHVQNQVKKYTRATAQPDLGLGHIREFTVTLPPLEEQRFIVEEVKRIFSVVDKLEATVEANLKQAFSGELVPQDPDDEPASVLLERIRSERRAADRKVKKARRAKYDDGAQGRLI